MGTYLIEPEDAQDTDAIDAVVRRAFAHHIEVADMVRAIRASDGYLPELAMVARCGDAVVGFVMISEITLVDDDRVRRAASLTPLAADPDHQRRGVGTALVLAAADEHSEGVVVLEGSPRYYGRLGFRFAPDHGITIDLPEGAPREAAQVYLLAGYDPAVRGHVQYPPAIADITG